MYLVCDAINLLSYHAYQAYFFIGNFATSLQLHYFRYAPQIIKQKGPFMDTTMLKSQTSGKIPIIAYIHLNLDFCALEICVFDFCGLPNNGHPLKFAGLNLDFCGKNPNLFGILWGFLCKNYFFHLNHKIISILYIFTE